MAKKVTPAIHGVTTKIVATSRCAIKVRDNYYTIEASAERSIRDADAADVDMDVEWTSIFDEVNTVVDNQMNEILETFGKK